MSQISQKHDRTSNTQDWTATDVHTKEATNLVVTVAGVRKSGLANDNYILVVRSQ